MVPPLARPPRSSLSEGFPLPGQKIHWRPTPVGTTFFPPIVYLGHIDVPESALPI